MAYGLDNRRVELSEVVQLWQGRRYGLDGCPDRGRGYGLPMVCPGRGSGCLCPIANAGEVYALDIATGRAWTKEKPPDVAEGGCYSSGVV